MTHSNCCCFVEDGAKPDLTFYGNAKENKPTILSKNGTITNYVLQGPIYADFETTQKIGYFEGNLISDSTTNINTGLWNYFLPEGTITTNNIVIKPNAYIPAPKQDLAKEIICGTGDFLGSKGFVVTIINDANVQPVRINYVYFAKCLGH